MNVGSDGHYCNGCKTPIKDWRTVLDNLCGLCFAKALDEMELLQEQFFKLIDSGMSREDANAEMIRRMEEARKA